MSDHKTYTARCVRSDGWWAISVAELPGVHTQARRLDQAEVMVREAIALMLDVPEDSFEVTLAPELPAGLAETLADVGRRKAEADAAQQAARHAALVAARALVAAGLTVRDAGRLLGVSYQRVAQLLASGADHEEPSSRRPRDRGRAAAPATTRAQTPADEVTVGG